GGVAAVVVVVGCAVVTVVVGPAVVGVLPSAPAGAGLSRREAVAAKGGTMQAQRVRLRCLATPMCAVSSSAGSGPENHPGSAGFVALAAPLFKRLTCAFAPHPGCWNGVGDDGGRRGPPGGGPDRRVGLSTPRGPRRWRAVGRHQKKVPHR